MSFGQEKPHPIVNFLNAEIISDEVIINWEIQGGSTCNGIDVLHSTDSLLNYSSIESLSGVCGDPVNPYRYTVTHEAPVSNSWNYYKLVIGTQGESTPVKAFFVSLGADGYILFPNPVKEEGKLYFNNYNNQIYTFSVYNLSGKQLNQKEVAGSEISLANLKLNPGFYLFKLIGENGNEVSGRFTVN